MVGTRSIVTSADTHNTLREMIDILDAVEAFTQGALARIDELWQQAEAVRARAEAERLELELFLDQFSLESGLSGGQVKNPTFLGGIVDLDAMRADVTNMSVNASKAEML